QHRDGRPGGEADQLAGEAELWEQQRKHAGYRGAECEEGKIDARDQQLGHGEQCRQVQPDQAGLTAPVHSGALISPKAIGRDLAWGFATCCCWPCAPPPSASLASSPMPPSVPISCVPSTGNRIVLALGLVANLPTASTYFCAMK